MTEPNQKLLADPAIATATLAGVVWPLAKMTLSQLYVAGPILLATGVAVTPARMTDLASVVFLSLVRGHPELTRKEFDEMTVTCGELIAAVKVISDQHAFVPAKTANGASAVAPLVTSLATSTT